MRWRFGVSVKEVVIVAIFSRKLMDLDMESESSRESRRLYFPWKIRCC